MRIVISIALAATLVSCGGDKKAEPEGQSFADAMKLACDAPDAIPDGKPADRITAAMKQVDPKITNKEARDLFGSFASGSGPDKVTALKAAVEKAHVSQCTLLELFRQLP